ncbi:hypothetical protein PENSUB_4778 [Penicillium subrubescens]|uniref:Uncharacterized protein n=1 Tax=Penicillium subrubescens TaxID=1316194 RepID=A0A1Q5UBJ7_9EURO|nr:hypothetical protein PENSUB_4778 [Penicillium subrubescens]
MSSNNYSIHSIIAAYGLGITPHGYYIVKMMANAKGQSSNILPRENLSNLKGRIPGQVWDKLARARGAHLNALEGVPMFAAAMASLSTLIHIKFHKANELFQYSWPVTWQSFPRKT